MGKSSKNIFPILAGIGYTRVAYGASEAVLGGYLRKEKYYVAKGKSEFSNLDHVRLDKCDVFARAGGLARDL